jgi:hypothetical protein
MGELVKGGSHEERKLKSELNTPTTVPLCVQYFTYSQRTGRVNPPNNLNIDRYFAFTTCTITSVYLNFLMI